MKTIKYIAAIITLSSVLSSIALNVNAASPNGPKLKCPNGQIPVLKNSEWHCATPSLKAPTQSRGAESSSGKTLNKAATIKPQRAKPDLSIANVMKLNSSIPNIDSFKVYVKNTQNITSPVSRMSIFSQSGSGDVPVGSIPANSGKWITVKFFEFKDGSRISLMVDSQEKIAETDEKNNKHTFNW